MISGSAFAEDKKADRDQEPGFTIGGRIHGLWEVTDLADKPANEFSIGMARLTVRWSYSKLLEAKLQGEFSKLFKSSSPRSLLRDAWVRIAPVKWLRFKLGQFKRPFSSLELRSRGQLAVIRRGDANGFLVEDLGFGDRDLGLGIDGRFGKRKRGFSYSLALVNGTGKNLSETDLNGSKDVVARIVGKPAKWLSMGAGASIKFFDKASVEYYPGWAWMAGADLQIKKQGFRLLAEGLVGDNYDRCSYASDPNSCRELNQDPAIPRTWSLVLLTSYKANLSKRMNLKLQPVLKGELWTPDHKLVDGKIMAMTVGLNLFVTRYARVMVHGEFIVPQKNVPSQWPRENRMLVQMAFDI